MSSNRTFTGSKYFEVYSVVSSIVLLPSLLLFVIGVVVVMWASSRFAHTDSPSDNGWEPVRQRLADPRNLLLLGVTVASFGMLCTAGCFGFSVSWKARYAKEETDSNVCFHHKFATFPLQTIQFTYLAYTSIERALMHSQSCRILHEISHFHIISVAVAAASTVR